MLRLSSNKFSSHQVDDEDEEKMVESDVLEESEYDTNIIVSEDPVDTLIEEKTEEKDVRETWLDAPTRIFVSLLLKLQPNLGKTFDLKNKNKMLEKCQKALADEGYNFSVKQVHSKYRTMERKYRLAKSRETKAGRKRKPIPYEKELDKLFGEESLCPQFSLDSTECEPSRETVVYSSLPRKNKSESNHLKILRKLDEIGKEKAQFHADMLQRLDKKEKIEQERNELLKRIATSLENSFNSYVQAHISNF